MAAAAALVSSVWICRPAGDDPIDLPGRHLVGGPDGLVEPGMAIDFTYLSLIDLSRSANR